MLEVLPVTWDYPLIQIGNEEAGHLGIEADVHHTRTGDIDHIGAIRMELFGPGGSKRWVAVEATLAEKIRQYLLKDTAFDKRVDALIDEWIANWPDERSLRRADARRDPAGAQC